MYRYFNPNPAQRVVGDCAVRAIAAAFDIPWDRAFDILAEAAKNMCDMPSSDAVWGAVLRGMGFIRESIPNGCPDCYTVEDFAEDNPRGVFVLGLGGHVVTVVDGEILDSWDSSNEIPVYVWRRDRERKVKNVR
jgi:hypothetical protein